MNYERAWEIVGKRELDELIKLKSTISTKHNQAELDHALQYFEKYIYDFPGEFFLQMPYLFTVRAWRFELVLGFHVVLIFFSELVGAD